MARTALDKEVRTTRYARRNTPAKRRRDLTVKYRWSYHYDSEDRFYYGLRDNAFWAAHKWTIEDVYEITGSCPLIQSENEIGDADYDPSDATSTSSRFRPPVNSVQYNKARSDARYKAEVNQPIRNGKKRKAATQDRSKGSRRTRSEPVGYVMIASSLPKHLRDPECSERRR